MNNNLYFLKSGVLSGIEMHKVFSIARKKKFALAAINCIDTNSINSILESSVINRTIAIIQFSFSGSIFFIGKNFSSNKIESAIYGSILAAKYVHRVSKYYKVPVILHTDHCNKKNLEWIDGLLEFNSNYYNLYKKSLFTSHMLDLSDCNIKENVNISCNYLKKMSKLNINLEMELGCTGGEEDGLDNRKISNYKLYTNPENILYVYNKFIKISNLFTIAAAFGNVHGVYKKNNIRLVPIILYNAQKLIKSYFNNYNNKNILNFVFHGGSGCNKKIIIESINYGVVKINLDTDIQWSFWNGILKYYLNKKKYLHNQLGNPSGIDKPNKKFYDPRVWLEYGKKSIINYLNKIYIIFNCINLF